LLLCALSLSPLASPIGKAYPNTPEKNPSQNSACLSSGGPMEEQAAKIGRGSGAEREGDPLQELGANSNIDSRGAVVQTSPGV
jgi:hypothetical protein